MQGEDQKKLDVVSNDVFCNALRSSGRTGTIASEEEDVPVAVEETDSGKIFICCYNYTLESGFSLIHAGTNSNYKDKECRRLVAGQTISQRPLCMAYVSATHLVSLS